MVKMYVPVNEQPKFFKPRPLLSVFRDGMTQEIQRMECEGIHVPMESSAWATPIVLAPKSGGRVRVCDDFKISIKTATLIKNTPIHVLTTFARHCQTAGSFPSLIYATRTNRICWTKLAGSVWLDLSTLIRLFQYTRLPFSVLSPGPSCSERWRTFRERSGMS